MALKPKGSPNREAPLSDVLTRASSVTLPRSLSEHAVLVKFGPGEFLRVGVDLGTAYLVLVVLVEMGMPLVGEWQFAQVVRDGLVVNFFGAIDLLRGMKTRLEGRLGRELTQAATAYPPGVAKDEVRASENVVEAAGFSCSGSIDEPCPANLVLHLYDSAIVDVGGGTTGIAVIRGGQVVYTADELTCGTYFSLVVAGSLGLSFEEAEALKITRSEHSRLFALVRPVMEKVANIILHHIQGWNVPSISLVGGASAFSGMPQVIQEYTGIPTNIPANPLSSHRSALPAMARSFKDV